MEVIKEGARPEEGEQILGECVLTDEEGRPERPSNAPLPYLSCSRFHDYTLKMLVLTNTGTNIFQEGGV